MSENSFPPPRAALIGASVSIEDREGVLDRAEAALSQHGIAVTRWSLGEPAPTLSEEDVVVVFGGDGALMSAIHALGYPTSPFFGVNHGRVGFLMNAPEPSEKFATRLTSGEVQRATYPVLEARLTLRSGETKTEHAFNDVVIERASGQTAQLDAFIDSVHLNRYSGDGLIVATPGGSTAYSLAAGGPVVHHDVGAMIVTPLNPHRPVQFHSLQFPTVLSLSSIVSVRNLDSGKRPVRCAIDGRAVGEIDAVEVRDAGRRVTLLRTPEYDFIDTLVRKVIGRSNGERGAVDG